MSVDAIVCPSAAFISPQQDLDDTIRLCQDLNKAIEVLKQLLKQLQAFRGQKPGDCFAKHQ
jgi:hypothetical protein